MAPDHSVKPARLRAEQEAKRVRRVGLRGVMTLPSPGSRRDRGRGRCGAAATLIAFVVLLSGLPAPGFDVLPLARAADLSNVVNRLPSPRSDTAAVWTGSEAYVLGGASSASILRYVPSTNLVTPMTAELTPAGITGVSAVWTGRYVFIFGGFVPVQYQNQILRYDPETDNVTRMGAGLAIPVSHASAVWDGRYAYVLGGFRNNAVGSSDMIQRYDPTTDTIFVVGRLPSVSWRTGAFYHDGSIYLVGGAGFSGGAVARFDGQGTELVATLPRGLQSPAVAFTGERAMVFGGFDGANYVNEILHFTPADRWLRRSPSALLSPLYAASAVWTGTSTYLFGGSFGAALDHITQVTPNRPPTAVVAPVNPAECLEGKAHVRLDGSGSHDPEGDALIFAWDAPGISFDDPASPTPEAKFPLGATTVSLALSDGVDEVGASVEVRVVDTLPPNVELTRPARGNAYVHNFLALPHAQVAPAVAVGPLTARAEARDQCGMVNVHFQASDGEQGNDAEPEGYNYTFRLDPFVGTDSNMTLTATARDLGGHTATDGITYLHVATTACPLVFGGGDECSVGGVEPPAGTGYPPPATPLPMLEETCRLLVGSVVCRDVLGA